MNLTKARELREQRARKISEARAIFDKSGRTADDTAKFDAMMAEADVMKAEIDREERLDAAENELRSSGRPPAGAVDPGNPDVVKHVEEYRKAEKRHGVKTLTTVRSEVRQAVEALNDEYWQAMRLYLALGNAMPPEARAILEGSRPELRGLGCGSILQIKEYRDMTTGGGNALQGSGGGYFVPVGFVDEIEEAMKWYGDMLQSSTIMDTATGQPLPFPTDNDTSTVGELVGEGTQVTEADVTPGNVILGAFKYSTKMVKVSLELLQDSAFDLESYVKERFAIRLGRILNTHFTTGAGTTLPKGIITAATAGPTAIGSSGNDGGSGTAANSIGSDDLVALEHSVDKAYRRGSAFMANDATIKFLKQLKDKYGRPLWLPGIAVGAEDTILGYEYFTNNDMATIATTNKTVLFGQLKKYLIRRVKEMAVLRLNERYADYGQVAFIGFARYDGNLLDAGTHPVKYLVQG
ncbi:MAG: phage major capsid protein [Patescibacteria group bacterium]|nr:phage major capsid protein [Patescibacteria group bacterium]